MGRWGEQEAVMAMAAPFLVGASCECGAAQGGSATGSPLAESPKTLVAAEASTPAQHRSELGLIVARRRIPLVMHDDEEQANAVALSWLESREDDAHYTVVDMKALITSVRSVEEFTAEFSAAVHASYHATLYIRHVDLLFVLLSHKSSFFPAARDAWDFDEAVELLQTLVRFGSLQLVCTATERLAMKGSKNIIARRFTPYAV